MDAAVNNPTKQRGRPFRRGVSGNPRGRPAGARNRRTLDAITLAEAEGELPLEFLLRTMRDPEVDLPTRVDVAKAAMPYLHARIAPTQVALVNITPEQPGDDAKLINGAPPAPSPLALELQAWEDELKRARERRTGSSVQAALKQSDHD
jgi:hypothetical protein